MKPKCDQNFAKHEVSLGPRHVINEAGDWFRVCTQVAVYGWSQINGLIIITNGIVLFNKLPFCHVMTETQGRVF